MSVLIRDPQPTSPDKIVPELDDWIDQNRLDVASLHAAAKESDETGSTIGNGYLSPEEIALYASRDRLVVNMLYRLSLEDGLSSETSDYIESSLGGYELDRMTQRFPETDGHNKAIVYGTAVEQLVEKCLKEPDDKPESDKDRRERRPQLVQSSVWIVAHEAMLRQQIYDDIIGHDKPGIGEKLSHSELHNPRTLAESSGAVVEKAAEYRGSPAKWLGLWAGNVVIDQLKTEDRLLRQALVPAETENRATGSTSLWHRVTSRIIPRK